MKKIIFQNLSITILSKLLGFLSFIYIAKILTEVDYGIFISINMILSLLPLFQFGSMHGIIILLPKYINNNTLAEKEKLFTTYNSFSTVLQIISVAWLYLSNIQISYWIILIIAINHIFLKYIENVQIYLNSHLQFEKANLLKAIDQILRPIFILLTFYIYEVIESIFLAHLLATFVSFIFTMKYNIKINNIKINVNYIHKIYKVGFFVYITWGIDILFRSVDRWFIYQYYSVSDLAMYGFTSALAMNIWLLSMSFFSPYSQLLYKAVAENNFIYVKDIVENTNKKLFILLGIISTITIIIYPYLLELIVHKYLDTYFLFSILVITSILLSINNMYIYYMISNNLHFILLKYQIIILIINLSFNGLFSYYHLNIIYFAYSTILSLAIYFILVKQYFYKDINKKIGDLNDKTRI